MSAIILNPYHDFENLLGCWAVPTVIVWLKISGNAYGMI